MSRVFIGGALGSPPAGRRGKKECQAAGRVKLGCRPEKTSATLGELWRKQPCNVVLVGQALRRHVHQCSRGRHGHGVTWVRRPFAQRAPAAGLTSPLGERDLGCGCISVHPSPRSRLTSTPRIPSWVRSVTPKVSCTGPSVCCSFHTSCITEALKTHGGLRRKGCVREGGRQGDGA